jgi:hypothetical protein
LQGVFIEPVARSTEIVTGPLLEGTTGMKGGDLDTRKELPGGRLPYADEPFSKAVFVTGEIIGIGDGG